MRVGSYTLPMRPKGNVLIVGFAAAALSALSACDDEAQQPAPGKEVRMSSLRITSPAFADSQPIPIRCTADGMDVNPELRIDGVPDGTTSLALIVDDPDAPMGTWVHWVLWNIPPGTTVIPEGSEPDRSVCGRNSWRRTGYGGPSPPSGTHRYFFKLYALDGELDLPPSAGKAELERAMEGHILATAQLMGTYER